MPLLLLLRFHLSAAEHSNCSNLLQLPLNAAQLRLVQLLGAKAAHRLQVLKDPAGSDEPGEIMKCETTKCGIRKRDVWEERVAHSGRT